MSWFFKLSNKSTAVAVVACGAFVARSIVESVARFCRHVRRSATSIQKIFDDVFEKVGFHFGTHFNASASMRMARVAEPSGMRTYRKQVNAGSTLRSAIGIGVFCVASALAPTVATSANAQEAAGGEKSASELLKERLQALQESRASDIRTPFLVAARNCIVMIEEGTDYNAGALRARYSETIDLDRAYSRQRWSGSNGLFGVRVGGMPGQAEDVVRTCSLREGAGIADEQIDAIQASLVELISELVASGKYEKGEWPKADDPAGRRAYSAEALNRNTRGCIVDAKLDVTSRWADFSIFEVGDQPCLPGEAGKPRP